MTRIRQIAQRLKTRVAEDGWLRTCGHLVRLVSQHSATRPGDDYDRRHGTDTTQPVPLWQLRITSTNAAHGVRYATSDEVRARVLLDRLPREVTLLDLGCGKGRMLLIASEMKFAAVIGVEFAPQLASIARENIRKTGARATVVDGDAATYDFPRGPLAVYLYDPFGPAVMQRVAARLRNRSGELWVIYVNPRCAEAFEPWMTRLPLNPAQARLFSEGSVAIFHRES
jgi:SAM-dependent methyltransferase